MYKRPSTEVNCCVCDKVFLKENRNIKEEVTNCCSKKCAAKQASRVKRVPLSYNLNNAKKAADKKGLEFNLDIEYLHKLHKEQYGKCAISNIDLILKFQGRVHGTEKNIYQISIDRIDNTKGYVKGNIQLVCLGINYLRNTFNVNEVIGMLQAIQNSDLL